MANNSHSNKLQNWHESFSLLDDNDDDVEEVLEDDEDAQHGSRRLLQENNRSFVEFLYDGGGTSTSRNHNSMGSLEDDKFELVTDVPVVRPETLSDSFIARSYPT